MSSDRQTVVVVGPGNLGRYVCEELAKSSRFDLAVISRKEISWIKDPLVVHRVDQYSKEHILPILNSTAAIALVSLLNPPPAQYALIHQEILDSCSESKLCKRFIPSEFAGNITEFPHLPRFYGTSREPFRQILAKQQEVEYTFFNQGWLMDYFLKVGKTYMPAIPHEFPIDPNGKRALIRGTGLEKQSFTCARDVATALVMLFESKTRWERETYICGQWATFKEALDIYETVTKEKLEVSYKSADRILPAVVNEEEADYELACVEEWCIQGATAVPTEIVEHQREAYFHGMQFYDIQSLLLKASKVDVI